MVLSIFEMIEEIEDWSSTGSTGGTSMAFSNSIDDDVVFSFVILGGVRSCSFGCWGLSDWLTRSEVLSVWLALRLAEVAALDQFSGLRSHQSLQIVG